MNPRDLTEPPQASEAEWNSSRDGLEKWGSEGSGGDDVGQVAGVPLEEGDCGVLEVEECRGERAWSQKVMR